MSRIFDVVHWATMPTQDLLYYYDHDLSPAKRWLFDRIYGIREFWRRSQHCHKWYGWRVVFWWACLPVHWIDYRIDRRFRAFARWTRGKVIFWNLRKASHWCCRQFERLYIHPNSDLPF